MSWIDKILPSGVSKGDGKKRSSVPEGLWKKCVKCDAVLYRPDLERNNDVCPKCEHHLRITARRRIELFLDADRQYSCAYFYDRDDDLETAQLNKKRHLAAKLAIEPGMKVLDLGCGKALSSVFL